MGMIASLLLAILVAVLSRLLADDAKAWSPRIAAWLIGRAVTALPQEHRDRLREEWAEYVSDTPGELTRLVAAAGFCVAGFRIQLAERRRLRRVEAREAVVRVMAEKYFFSDPHLRPFKELFARRLRRCLNVGQVEVLAAIETHAQQLARVLRGEMKKISTAFLEAADSAEREMAEVAVRTIDLPSDFLEALIESVKRFPDYP